jgi:hypothetical protein
MLKLTGIQDNDLQITNLERYTTNFGHEFHELENATSVSQIDMN